MPFTTIRTEAITLNFIDERLEIGDKITFIEKMDSYMSELELWSSAINDTADDMNTVATEIDALQIGTAYEVAVQNGYIGSEEQWLLDLVGPQGPQGIQGIPGIAGSGAGYTAAPWSTYTPIELAALPTGTRVIADDGRIVQLTDNAVRYNWGTVADTTARDALSSPQHGDYVRVTADSGQYHYYDSTTPAWVDSGSEWLVTPSATNYGTVADIAARDAIATLEYKDHVLVDGQFHYFDGTAWVDTTGATNHGVIADLAARDALPSPALNDHGTIGGVYHYYDGTDWVSTGASTNHGALADTAARDAIVNPQLNDYATISGGYHYYNGSAWVDASGSTNHGALASDTERDAIVSPATNDHAIVAGDFHYFDGTDWVDSGAAADYGSVDTIAQRDALPTLKRNDYVSIGGNYHYVDDDLEWVNTFSSTKQVVPPNPELSPDSITSSWSEVTKLPTVATTADLDRIDWGNYPDGVYVEDTGQVAYRDTNVPKVYQDLCGTSATAWLSRGWLNSAATAGQAMRVQIEVTADTYCRIGFQPGTDSSDSLMVEVQPTAIRGYDDFSAVGSPITVEVGDVIGIFRLTNGQTTINVNSVDVYTFARSDTSAMNIYAYLFGIDDCARYVQHGVDGLFLDPVVWTGYSDATMTESGRTEDYGWSYDDPDVTAGTTDNRMRVVFRSAGQKPELGGWSNIYPDGATVPVGLLVNNDLFTLLVAPGESVVVDGNTIAIDAGYSNLEPVHFAKINSAIVRIGGN